MRLTDIFKIKDEFDKARYDEEVAKIASQFKEHGLSVFDVGIGVDVLLKTGLTEDEITSVVLSSVYTKEDGGYGLTLINTPKGDVDVYITRMKRVVNIGTRIDYETNGISEICDAIDNIKKGKL